MYEAAAESLETTIYPNSRVLKLIHAAREEMCKQIVISLPDKDHPADAPIQTVPRYIAVHIRRGDQNATSWANHGGYVPITDFVEAVGSTWKKTNASLAVPQVYLASDSPSAVGEFKKATGYPEVFSLSQSENPELQTLASPGEYFQKEFEKLPQAARTRATTGMLVDFAMLSGAWTKEGDLTPDAVVCTIRYAINDWYSRDSSV